MLLPVRLDPRFGKPLLAVICLALSTQNLSGQDDPAQGDNSLWDMKVLSALPKTHPAPHFGAADLKSIYFESEPYQGQPTRVFAYYGLPATADSEHSVPGVVCVHGGGGTAFAEWVRIWNRHGFAAIAIDTNGAVPQSPQNDPDDFRHAWAGPRRFSFGDADKPLRDHWNYHAVAAVIRANSLLRSFEGVDAAKVGVTGISWGGYKTSIVVGIDHRFRFAIPVYGCGFIDESATMAEGVNDYGAATWMRYWDPSVYLKRARLPMLWINGTNDQHYQLPMFEKSARLTQGKSTLVIRKEMDHGHGSGWSPQEIYAFAKAEVGQGEPLVRVDSPQLNATTASVGYVDGNRPPVVKAELLYTRDVGPWRDRHWEILPAHVDSATDSARAELPDQTTVLFFNLTDQRQCVVSSPYLEIR